MIQEMVAESYAERQAARLLTLQAAWKMDQLHAAGKHYSDARVEIGVIKFWGAKVLYNVIDRAIQVHGSLGYTTDLPLESMYRHARAARIYDGPDEVHKVTVARQVLKGYRASETADRARPDPPGGRHRQVRRPPRRPSRSTADDPIRVPGCIGVLSDRRPVTQTLRWRRTLGWGVTGTRRCRWTRRRRGRRGRRRLRGRRR